MDLNGLQKEWNEMKAEVGRLREALESIKVDVEIRTDFSVGTLRKVILRYVDKALKEEKP